MIAVRRDPKGLLECSGEMKPAQSNELREVRERNRLGKVLVNEGQDSPLLPSCETPADLLLKIRGLIIETLKLMQDDESECFEILLARRRRILDQLSYSERGRKQQGVFEEHTRRVKVADLQLRGIEVDEYEPHPSARLLVSTISTATPSHVTAFRVAACAGEISTIEFAASLTVIALWFWPNLFSWRSRHA
jgi:hypothetical protein